MNIMQPYCIMLFRIFKESPVHNPSSISVSGVMSGDRREGINTSVSTDVQSVFKGKTYSQLQALYMNIENKIQAGGSNLDIGYWESLLQQVRVYMARARCVSDHNCHGTLGFLEFSDVLPYGSVCVCEDWESGIRTSCGRSCINSNRNRVWRVNLFSPSSKKSRRMSGPCEWFHFHLTIQTFFIFTFFLYNYK